MIRIALFFLFLSSVLFARGWTQEELFSLGVTHFRQGEYGFANVAFSQYLKGDNVTAHFDEVVRYKYLIAEKMCKNRGFKYLPRWFSGEQDPLEIYEEVATLYPHDELAACSLYNKGKIQLERRCFKEAVETFQTVIRRFSRTEMAEASFEAIGVAYLEQAKAQPNNPDFLGLALINLKKFRLAFPGEERACALEELYLKTQELYACSFYEMGRYYERTEHLRAAWIYYMTTIKEFPRTRQAACARERLYIICSQDTS